MHLHCTFFDCDGVLLYVVYIVVIPLTFYYLDFILFIRFSLFFASSFSIPHSLCLRCEVAAVTCRVLNSFAYYICPRSASLSKKNDEGRNQWNEFFIFSNSVLPHVFIIFVCNWLLFNICKSIPHSKLQHNNWCSAVQQKKRNISDYEVTSGKEFREFAIRTGQSL